MASITTTTGADSKPRYIVNYRDPDGRQRRKSFKKRAEALAFSTTTEASILTGTYLDPTAGRMLFEDYAREWLTSRTFEETTREAVDYRLKLHVYPVLGSRMLSKIKPSTIQSWLKGLDHLAPTYRRVMFANVSSIMTAAVDDELILKNPCSAASVTKPPATRKKITPWDADMVAAMHAELPEKYRIFVTLGAGVGMRQGEIFGLSPNDADFLRGEIEIQRQVKLYASNRAVFDLPKGNKARSAPMPSSVRDELAAHLARWPARSVELPWKTLTGKTSRTQLVTTSRESGATNRNYFNEHVWHPALKRAGIEQKRENGMHALRHFYASTLLAGGTDIRSLSEWLGHADPGFTLRTYTHLMPGSDDRARQTIDDALSSYTTVTSTGAKQA